MSHLGPSFVEASSRFVRLAGSTIDEGANFAFGTVSGSQVGTSPGQKLAFFGTAARVQPTGWTAATGVAYRGGFDTATVTAGQVAQTLKALIDDLYSAAGLGLLGP